MMLYLLFLAIPFAQTSTAPAPRPSLPAKTAPQQGASHQQWWSQLPPEERAQLLRNLEEYKALPPEERAQLERRRLVFEQEKEFLLQHLSEEERTAFDSLSEREQASFLRQGVHRRLRQRGQELEHRFPGIGPGRAGFEEVRFRQIQTGLEKAVRDGWIGSRTAQWLLRASVDEAMEVLMAVHKWEFLEAARANQFWQEHHVDEHQRHRITALPAPEFFREIRALNEGPLPDGLRPGAFPHGSRRHFAPPPR